MLLFSYNQPIVLEYQQFRDMGFRYYSCIELNTLISDGEDDDNDDTDPGIPVHTENDDFIDDLLIIRTTHRY